jgi:hypothetical protein
VADIEVVFARGDKRVVGPDGAQGMIRKGQHWPADDPVVQQHPEMFTSDPRYGLVFSAPPAGFDAPEPPVEQTTAAPGERRGPTSRTAARAR